MSNILEMKKYYDEAKKELNLYPNEKGQNTNSLKRMMEVMESLNIGLGGEINKIEKESNKKSQIERLNQDIVEGKFSN